MKAIFERKPSDFDLRSFEVSKTIRLSAEAFEDVLKNPMRDYTFIQENTDLMHCDSSGVYHCLLLTGEGRNEDCWWNRRATVTAGMPLIFPTFPL